MLLVRLFSSVSIYREICLNRHYLSYLTVFFGFHPGSAWVVLTKSFLEFCVWGWDNLSRTLLMYYTNFVSSPEGYFHTVICNHKDYQNTTINHDLRYIRWDNPPKQHPVFLKLEHFDDMVQG